MTQPSTRTPATHRLGTLLPGSHVTEYTIQRDEERHAFVVNHTLIPCTPAEYRVLALLLAHVNQSVPYASLIACLHVAPTTDAVSLKQTRTRLAHLISDVRAKIWPLDWEIVAVMQTGYLLLSAPKESVARAEHHAYQERRTMVRRHLE